MLKYFYLLVLLCVSSILGAKEGFGDNKQDYGYITVRPKAHMFWWLFYTTADVAKPEDRPLVIWLQGGPGASSTGYGNFEELGPLTLELDKRNTTWVNEYNVLFIDNPVGTGFSYVEANSALTKDNAQIAADLVTLMKGFYKEHPEFKKAPLHIYSESYGGKMAAEFAFVLNKEIKLGNIDIELVSVGMGDAWISPIDSVLGWADYLWNFGLVDSKGYRDIQGSALATKKALDAGQYELATSLWGQTEYVIIKVTHGVDFYNVLTPQEFQSFQARLTDFKNDIEGAMYKSVVRGVDSDRDAILYDLMNGAVKEALNIPKNVVWGGQSSNVFNTLRADFMKPVTDVVELLLNTTTLDVVVFTGNLDLIVDTPGTIKWVEALKWPGSGRYLAAPRLGIGPHGILEGYSQSYKNFFVYWANRAGHMVPADNPVVMSHILQKHTQFP